MSSAGTTGKRGARARLRHLTRCGWPAPALLITLLIGCKKPPCDDGSDPRLAHGVCACDGGQTLDDDACASEATPRDDAGPAGGKDAAPDAKSESDASTDAAVPASEWGELGTTPVIVEGAVAGSSAEDHYRFALTAASLWTLHGTEVRGGPVQVQLFEDRPPINESQPLYAITAGPSNDQQLEIALPAGAYLLRVIPSNAANTGYKLTASSAQYEPAEETPDPGEDKSGALDLGALAGAVVIRAGYVGKLDEEDYYRFSLLHPAAVALDVTDVEGAGGHVQAQLFPDAPTLNESAPMFIVNARTDTNGHLDVALPAGIFFLRVVPIQADRNNNLYTATLAATPYTPEEVSPDPGDDKGAATDLGPLDATPVIRGGYIGALDHEDYYRFSLPHPASVVLDVTSVEGPRSYVQAQIFPDAATINENAAAFVAYASAGTNGHLEIALPAGVFFVRVVPVEVGRDSNLYTVTMTATSYTPEEVAPDPGGDKDSARELGALSGTPIVRGGYVGKLDEEDYYRFNLASAASVVLDVTSVTGPLSYVQVQIFPDAPTLNENTPARVVYASAGANGHLEVALPAGVFFLRVVPAEVGRDSNLYTLTVYTGG